jgi:hypothetical protein
MQTSFGDVPHFGVFCSDFIAKGVRFGPFRGRVVNASEVKAHRDNSRMWEVSVFLGVGGAEFGEDDLRLGEAVPLKAFIEKDIGVRSSRTSLCMKSTL